MSWLLDRTAAAGGILFVLLVGVGYSVFLASYLPESLDSPQVVSDHFASHPVDAGFWAGVAMESVGTVLLLLFAMRLLGWIRAAQPPDGWLAQAASAALVIALAVTLKYCPAFPGRFGSIQDARAFCAEFFEHYNHVHRHSGIGLHTPASVHYGTATEIREQRTRTLDAAYTADPARFRHRRPLAPTLPAVAWINEPTAEANIKSA